MAKKKRKLNLQDMNILKNEICLKIDKAIPDDISDEDYNLLLWSVIYELSLGQYNSLVKEKLRKEK